MAIVKSTLVNDGGAPARIINLEAGAAILAGQALMINTSGQAVKATAAVEYFPMAGVALTDADSGDQVSMITGSGIVCNILTAAVTAGDNLKCVADGELDTQTSNTNRVSQAVALETNAVDSTVTKCLVF